MCKIDRQLEQVREIRGKRMKTIHMIDDYRILCEEIGSVGKFESYKSYTQKYSDFFKVYLSIYIVSQ